MPNTTLRRIESYVGTGERKKQITESDGADAAKEYTRYYPLPTIPAWEYLLKTWVPTILRSCNDLIAMEAIHALLEYRALRFPKKSWESYELPKNNNAADWKMFLQPDIILKILSSDDATALSAIEIILGLRGAQRVHNK